MNDSRKAERKSSSSNSQGTCLQVGIDDTGFTAPFGAPPKVWAARHFLTIRNDTIGLNGGLVRCTPSEWRAFIEGVKRGEFDLDENELLPESSGVRGT
jgi:Domain of unknown function (DUF397)